jgi:hypothetical protein
MAVARRQRLVLPRRKWNTRAVIRCWNPLVALALCSCWTAQNTPPPAEPKPEVATDIPADCKVARHTQLGAVELTTCSIAHGGETEWRAYLGQGDRVDPLDEPNVNGIGLAGAIAGAPVAILKVIGVDGREAIQIWRLDNGAPQLAGTFDGKTADVATDEHGASIKTCEDACTTKSARWVDGALVVEAQ